MDWIYFQAPASAQAAQYKCGSGGEAKTLGSCKAHSADFTIEAYGVVSTVMEGGFKMPYSLEAVSREEMCNRSDA